ncbi:carboxypeptidase-like regulatory domain-containing protein [Flavobacteriaceae bacterium AH-315-B10]|nr:carboxypeptidase-like regulatory domain-containing protein [Flavobacteriaceae bacterium AH-315-B10]
MKQALLLLTFLYSTLSFSQIIGNVTDSEGNSLAFVNIFIEDTYIGTTSNDEGDYELNLSENKSITIVFKYLGYKTLKKVLTIDAFPYVLNVSLEKENITLDEVVINSNENPANKIIRSTIANRKAMLEKIKSYKANFYSRGLIRIKEAPEKILGQDLGDLGGGLDSTRSGIIYLSETISKIEFQRPDKLKEKIIASKVSGNDNGFSFNNASDVDYNFYNNTVELGNQIVSPIADYAFNYYRYKLEGVFYDDIGNLINKIKVIPKRENDRIFSGTIYIVEDQWSIYALELDITGQQAQIPAVDIITLKQTFSYSENDTFWVLISQSIDFKYGIFGIKGDGRFTAVYSKYDFNPNFTKKTFTKEVLSFADQANKKDSTYWDSIRPVPLTNEESNDYVKKDSIQIIRESKTYLDSIDRKNNKFKLPNILFGYNYQNSYKDWNLNFGALLTNTYFNTVQGYNSELSINYRKNLDEFKRYFNINSSLNYSFSDNRLRGTASITYKFNNISRPFVTLSGGIKTQQFNASQPISPLINSISTLFFEDNYMKLYDKSFAQISYSEELFNGLRFYSTLSYEKRKPLFNTTDQTFFNDDNDAYTSNNPLDETAFRITPFITHNILKLNVYARINFGQEYLSYPDSKFNITNSKYPTLLLGYEKGFGATNSNYNFGQIKARLYQGFDVANKGYLQYNLKAGTFFNADDIAFMDYQHFNGNQTRIGSSNSYINVFNNLPYYALSTNKSYLEFHVEHNFKGYILGKIPLLNTLNYNLVISAHALSTENNKPYQEYSIGIDNIGFKKFRFLRIDYVRSYQSGFKSDAVIFGLKFLNIIN